MVLLTACGGTVYRTSLEVYCPSIKDYSPDYNQQLATEVEELPSKNSAIETAIQDYAALRDDIRVCRTEKDKL